MTYQFSRKISASILAIKKFPEKIVDQSILAIMANADIIHFDVAKSDGKATKIIEESSDDTSSFFTPNLLSEIKQAGEKRSLVVPIDVHIMDMEPSESLIQEWISVKPDYLAIHWEAFNDKKILLDRISFIKNNGIKTGLALRPDVDIGKVIDFIVANPNLIDLISQCGVYPCVGGQTMAYHILNNVRKLAELRKEKSFSYEIMIDGGVKPGILSQKCFEIGANILVAGSAFFGKGDSGLDEMHINAQALKTKVVKKAHDIYTIIAEKIYNIRAKKQGKIWILIEGYHGSGKTFITQKIEERLVAMGTESVVIPLDFSWTDRTERARWKDEAYLSKEQGIEHNYFNSLNQNPEPMHWRQGHSKQALLNIASMDGKAIIENCYQFNETGDTKGKFRTHITDNSILLIEGVYASLAGKEDWDMRIYVSGDIEGSKKRAMVRDEIKVFRPQEETKALYEDVYESSYNNYVQKCNPIEKANIVIDNKSINKDEIDPKIIMSTPSMIVLECMNPDCKRQYSSVRIDKCEICDSDLNNVIIGNVNFLDSIIENEKNMWRYRKFTTVKAESVVSNGEGNTPIVYMKEASKKLGVHVWIKLEIVNPTGTFKDREASYVVSLSRQYGQDNIVMQSTGNTAVAITHYAGLADISSWCFIPESSCYKTLMPPKKPKNRIIAVKGHPIDIKTVAADFAKHFNFPKVSPFFERCEANAMMGYETGEALLSGNLPEKELLRGGGFDYYIQTISAGMGAIGFFYGMKRLEKWTNGKIKSPKIFGVEISEFAPIHYAWEHDLKQVGEDVATPFFPDHALFEPTLWTTNIRKYYPHLRKMLKDSKGMFCMVEPEEVGKIIEEYGIRKEIEAMGYRLSDTENSAFIGFTGMIKKIISGEIPKESRIILMLTGKGHHNNFVHVKPDFVVDPKIHKPQDIMDNISS